MSMELISEIVINATTHYVSDTWQTLTHLWEPKIASFTPTKYGLSRKYGGYVRPKWGNRSFTPDLFADDWPPPTTVTVTDKLTDSTEAAATTVFEGTLHLDSYNEEEVSYDSYGEEYTDTVTDQVYADTLVNIFTSACTTLGLTLDSTAARSSSPAVSYTATGEKLIIDNLEDMAAFFTHGFYIKAGTLYLYDMLDDNGTSTLDEFGFFRGSKYEGPEPISLYKSGDYSIDGSHKYGKELSVSPTCHGTQANVEAALGDIKTVMEYRRFMFRMVPESDRLPAPGEKITVTNESLQSSTTSWLRTTDYMVSLDKQEIVVEGYGVET